MHHVVAGEVTQARAQTEQQTQSGDAMFDGYASGVFRTNRWNFATSNEEAYNQFRALLRQAKGN